MQPACLGHKPSWDYLPSGCPPSTLTRCSDIFRKNVNIIKSCVSGGVVGDMNYNQITWVFIQPAESGRLSVHTLSTNICLELSLLFSWYFSSSRLLLGSSARQHIDSKVWWWQQDRPGKECLLDPHHTSLCPSPCCLFLSTDLPLICTVGVSKP